jgi:two-component system, OmpR family, phosphate regulon sensor histidine kinase PhoR
VWDTVSKVLNKVKTSFTSPYFKVFLIFFVLINLLIFFLFPYYSALLPVILINILVVIFYVYIHKAREREIFAVKEIIKNIRNSVYTEPGDIHLPESLTPLEKEIKLMFEKTRKDIDYLRKLERMRTEFIGNVSHELRTPIFTIQGYIETLLNGAIDDTEVNYKFLEKANLHTINLSNLVNDLINISMIESGEMRMSFRYFNINSFIREIISEINPLAEEKNLLLSFEPARDNLLLFGDKTRLKQVMLNLITNAIKYTDSGKVEVIIREEPKTATIIIRDTGIGIADTDKERIFERFYRVDKARSKSAGGTGLGLAIVKHIIEAHESVIELKSSLNNGSEFFFKLKK